MTENWTDPNHLIDQQMMYQQQLCSLNNIKILQEKNRLKSSNFKINRMNIFQWLRMIQLADISSDKV